MGRSQVVQAETRGIEPRVDMNPILLKPLGNNRVQVILQRQVFGTLTAQQYYEKKPFFLGKVLESHARLASEFDLVVIEEPAAR